MARKTVIKSYAVDIVKELRKEHAQANKRTPAYVDLADVDQINPQVIISPHHDSVEYDEEDIIFQINPNTLKVGDTVILGRDPSGQPMVLGIADSSGGPVSRDITELKTAIAQIKRALRKLSVNTSEDFLPRSGGTMTGNITMSSGTKITIPDLPVDDTDAANKAYVDHRAFIKISEVDSPYYALATDHVIFVDTSVDNVDVVLPNDHEGGREYIIKNTSNNSNQVHVYSLDADTIDGNPDFTITVGYQSISLISDGDNWSII